MSPDETETAGMIQYRYDRNSQRIEQRIEVISVKFVLYSLLMTALLAMIFPAPAAAPEAIRLPQPVTEGTMSLEKTLHERRSVRQYGNAPISLGDLSQMLWAAQGISGAGGKRTAPSAGALYPLDLYVIAGAVAGLSAGVYSYDPHRHQLAMVAEGDARRELSRAALGQSTIKNAAAVLAVCAVYERTTFKYGERGTRYVHMEAGHAAQNASLQAVALGLGTVVVGAFDDDQVKTVLRLSEREHPLLLMPMGKR